MLFSIGGSCMYFLFPQKNMIVLARFVGGIGKAFLIFGFSKKSYFLDRIRLEHVESKNSSDFELQI